MAAEAALRALEEFAEGSLSFELIGVKHIRAFDSNLVIVSIGVRDSAGTRLVGCYLCRRGHATRRRARRSERNESIAGELSRDPVILWAPGV